MPSFCAALNCTDKYGHADSNISFHKFPLKQKHLLEKWLKFAQRDNWTPSRWSSICCRHFRDEDFRCVHERRILKKDAVPSILYFSNSKDPDKKLSTSKSHKRNDYPPDTYSEDEHDHLENLSLVRNTTLVKSNCRLCGHYGSTAVTFSCNFEIYGMIQKCFPTLNINQDDSLPKDMCHMCLKQLKTFASFIDMVLETQSDLQRNFRPEKQSNKASDRQLKIKQEPIVRIKQEQTEEYDNFLPEELDLGVDEHCDHEADEIDEKLQFCDFPMLNTQDIINNCDIMEIINLDDPFINIPDDDVNVNNNCNSLSSHELPSQKESRSAHELLQTHLILEEHNYSHVAEEDKEDWKMINSYKTEKPDAYEQNNINNCQNFPMQSTLSEQQPPVTSTAAKGSLSSRPIVTSVSSICDSNIHFSMEEGVNNRIFTSSSTKEPPQHPIAAKQTEFQRKPNIVVLNESIVQSSAAFQLHTCTECQLKFFGIETLNQHYLIAHAQAPMVSVPSGNVVQNSERQMLDMKSSCKIEQDNENSLKSTMPNFSGFDMMKETNMIKNKINILEIKQSFSSPNLSSSLPDRCLLDIQENLQLEAESLLHGNNGMHSTFNNQLGLDCETVIQEDNFEVNQKKRFSTQTQQIESLNRIIEQTSKKYTHPEKMEKISQTQLNKMFDEYKKIQTKIKLLKRKYRKMQRFSKRKKRLTCRRCNQRFTKITELMRHKQQKKHFILKPRTKFAENCPGCEKFFYHKIGLNNHMRYICQSLSLRWLLPQMKTFRCRHCCKILFTHWRLCRKHEIKCKLKQKLMKKRLKLPSKHKCQSPQKRKTIVESVKNYKCEECHKQFMNPKSFYQHKITHTSERKHKCNLCERVFKRRNGLMQHVKSFHLQIKPHECSLCHHRYALKSDMQRCRHSNLLKDKKTMKH